MKTVAGTPNSRKHSGARAPLLSHATARPRHAGTSFESQAQQGGRRLESQPTGTPQRYDLTHCHPGQARTVYPKSQSGGYLESVSKNTADQGVCGGDMSLPNGTCETRNVKSGSEKGIDAGHVGDITSGAAETPL